MDKPNYVLRANEGVLVPKNENGKGSNIFKIIVSSILVILILGSIVFQENLFSELSWSAQVLLVLMTLSLFFTGRGKQMVPSPFEIRFYDEYLIIYREKHYYSKKVTKKEFNKFFYKDITECRYRTVSQKINIFGFGEFKWYDYNKDGSLPSNPNFHKKVDGITWFYTSEDPKVDFVSEIEKHSPLKVSFSES